MRVRVLGSAAGGGSPQWNCRCDVCQAVRGGVRADARTQSSIAVRGRMGPWFLVNASPDVRTQIEGLERATDDVRAAPFAGVLLTDAEIDHTAGLLLLRESSERLRVLGAPAVERALRAGNPVLDVLDHYCGVDWTGLRPGEPHRLRASSLTVEPFATGGDAPRYASDDDGLEAWGYVITDDDGTTMTYAPGLAAVDDAVLDRMTGSDLVLVDGTFWREDELARHGIAGRGAAAMGHVPLSGPEGSLAALAGLDRPRVVLVHINNTNPILLAASPERDEVLRAGVEIAHDGLEVEL